MNKTGRKTYAGLQAQIEKLQKEADALRAAEIQDVVTRIRQAISHYGLTPADLGFAPRPGRELQRGSRARGPVRKAATKAARGKASSTIKYRDESGNSWCGRGKRPRWFVEALAGGRTPEELLAKS